MQTWRWKTHCISVLTGGCVIVIIVVAPPLSVDVVATALESLTRWWRDLGKNALYIPDTVLDGFKSEYSSDAERLRGAVRYWLLRDPLASWRKLIHELDDWPGDKFCEVADAIRNNAEKQPEGQQQSLFMPPKESSPVPSQNP